MAETTSPRRAVFVADPVTGSWHVGRSRGWSSDAAAQEAVWLLDTDGASLLVPDFAGFFNLARGSWVVVRGGVAPPPNRTGRYRREAIGLEENDFARVRFNPFRILPDIGGENFETPADELPTPEIPNQLEPGDDINRLRELESRSRDQRPAAELEALLAAVLDREHTLATGSRWSYEDLELLMLLLPPPLRPTLTFHSFATSIPPDPVPRLVLTRLTDGRSFEGASPIWGHRLPGTVAEIPANARNAAAALIELLATPDRLVEAHEAYAQHGWAEGASAGLLGEVETLLRVGRRAGRQQTPHDAALRALMEAATINSGGPLDGGGRGEVTPETLGNAVARRLRSGQLDLAAPALVMERFFSRRHSHPGHFAEFARRLDGVLDGLALPEDENATRIRTMLLLLAATRGDAAGVADALVVPVPRDMIARLGGINAWLAPGEGRAAEAVRALALADDAESTVDAVIALADLNRELPSGPRRVRLAHAGLQTIRTAYRKLPADRWEAGLAISTAGLDLFESAASSGPLGSHSLQAEVENEIALADRSDAEVFLGFLGVAASPCCLSRWEIADGSDALVEEVLDRIRQRNETGDPAAEASHWSFALLDRVRRGQVDDSAVVLAAKLLQLAAPEGAGRALAAYIEQQPDAVSWLFDYGELSRLLDDEERVILFTGALQRALDAAADSRDSREVITVCKRLRDAGVQFGAAALRLKFETRLRATAAAVRENAADAQAATQVSALQAAMSSIVDHDGLTALQGILAPPEPPPTEEPEVAGPEPNVIPLPRRRSRARSVVLAAASIAALVLGIGGVWRWIAGGGPPFMGGPSPSMGAPLAGSGSASSRRIVAADLADARSSAAVNDWENVVDVLSRRAPPPSHPDMFAWDSLLAEGALRRAQGLAGNDSSRARLLDLSWERSSRALAAARPFAPGTLALRLMRAEACIAGPLECEPRAILEDLLLASRSRSPQVNQRASALLARQR